MNIRHVITLRILAGLWFAALSVPSVAQDAMQQRGHEGERDGRRFRIDHELRETTVDPVGRSITLPGSREHPETTTIQFEDLIPGDDPAEQARLEALYKLPDSEMQKAAEAKRLKLETEQSSRGEAYRTMRESATITKRDIHADEDLTGVARHVARQEVIKGLEDAFPDCTTTTTLRQVGFQDAETYQDRACQRLATPPTCTHTRDVNVVPTNGTYQTNESVQADIRYSINVADYMPGFVGGTVSAAMTWSGTVGSVTITQQPTAGNAYSLEIAIAYDTTGCDPANGACPAQTANITIELAAAVAAGGEITSSPPECLEGDDGFCAASWTCLESGSRVVNGVLVDESSAPFLPRLYEGEPETQLCWRAEANYRCTYPMGEVCGEGAGSGGGTMCETVTEDTVSASSCAVLRDDPLCAKTRTQCASNAVGSGAFCYVEVDSYRCKRIARAPVVAVNDRFSCDTPIRCMGSDCLTHEDGDPATTEPRLNHQEELGLLQHALSDYDPTCTAPPCRHFVGEALKCHRATGGSLSFCVEENSVASKTLYMRWFDIQTRRAAAIALENADTGPEVGGWADLQSAANWTLTGLQSKYLTSVKEGIQSNGESPRRTMVETPTTKEQFEDMLGQQPPLINLAHVYGRYVRTVEMPTSGWEGNAEEFELFKKRGLHQCLHVGDYCQAGGGSACPSVVESYCCFSTALSKSIHEHLGTDFGDARAPSCTSGTDVPVERIVANRTFVASEWTAMQTLAGIQPNMGNMDALSDDDHLTGQGSSIRLSDQTRDSLTSRTGAMLSRLDGQGIHDAVEADARTRIPEAVEEPSGPGTVTFSPALYFGDGQRPVFVRLYRNGKQGAVSTTFSVTSPAGAGGTLSPSTGRVSWADGESGSKQIVLKVNAGLMTPVERTFHIVLGATSGGLGLGDRPSATILLKGPRQP